LYDYDIVLINKTNHIHDTIDGFIVSGVPTPPSIWVFDVRFTPS